MTFIDHFLPLMTQQVSVTAGTLNEYGDFTPGATVDYPCRIQGKRMMTLDSAGRETLSTVQIFIGSNTMNLTADLHRYTLPSPWLPSGQRQAIAVKPHFDETGPAFCTVFLP